MVVRKGSSLPVYLDIVAVTVPVTATTPAQGYWMKHIGANTYNTGGEWPPAE